MGTPPSHLGIEVTELERCLWRTRGRNRDTGLDMEIDIGDMALVIAVLNGKGLVIAVLIGMILEHVVL